MGLSHEGKVVLIAGSAGMIASKLVAAYRAAGAQVVTVSSKSHADINVNLTEKSSVPEAASYLNQRNLSPDLVICCSGLLHDKDHMPEKSLADFESSWFMKSISMNVMPSVHLAQAVESRLTKQQPMVWASLSAMVGSITDNYLGGWYSYRMSKSALNMFVKNLSIEWTRKNKSNKVFAIHPGTTRSPMSEPFKVRKDKLYEPELSSSRIKQVLDKADSYETGQFINWNGQKIPW